MSYLTINDLSFDVPASDISVDHINQTFEWPGTLRTRHSTKLKPGKGEILVAIRLKVFQHEQWKLHRLAVEFKYTPFWQIENEFLRKAIDPTMHPAQNLAFAATGMDVSSVPGQPGFWNVDLALKYFNYSPYLNNFLYKKEWIGEPSPGKKWTIYSIPIQELIAEENESDQMILELDRSSDAPDVARFSLDDPPENSQVSINEETITDRVKDKSVIRMNNNTVEVGDLSPLPYETLPTDAVDCHDSDVYSLYINKLVVQDGGLAISPDNFEALSDFISLQNKNNPRPYPFTISDAFYNEGGVSFTWREFKHVEPDPALAQLVTTAAAIRSQKTNQTVANSNAFVLTGEPIFLVPHSGPITSGIGKRNIGIGTQGKEASRDHKGIDIDGAIGNPIVSPCNGVIFALDSWQDGNKAGNRIWIQDTDNPGYRHGLFHLQSWDSKLYVGKEVKIGEVVAYMGNSGNNVKGKGADGSHLHWQVEKDGNIFDPRGVTANQGSDAAKALLDRLNNKANTVLVALPVVSDIQEELTANGYDEQEIENIFRNTKSQHEDLANDGWTKYESQHIKNVYYKYRTLTIQPSHTGSDGAILTGVALGLNNRIVSIPLSGHQHPTAQHLGGYDNKLFMTFASITQGAGHPSINEDIATLNEMVNTLESNARKFRQIPGSWNVSVHSFISVLAGHKTYVVDRVRNDVGPGNPGLSTLELTFISSLDRPEEKLARSNSIDRETAVAEIVKFLLSKMRIEMVEGREKPKQKKEVTFKVTKTITVDVNASDNAALRGYGTPVSGSKDTQTLEAIITAEEWAGGRGSYPISEGWSLVPNSNEDFSQRKNEVGKPIIPTGKRLEDINNTVTPGRVRDIVNNGPLESFSDIGFQGDASNTLDENKESPIINGRMLQNGIERNELMPNVWQVRYSNLADPDDTLVYGGVRDLITFMQFASAVLSDQYYGGWSPQELPTVLNMHGMEKWILPSFEHAEKSVVGLPRTSAADVLGEFFGLSPSGTGTMLSYQLKEMSRFFTSTKVQNKVTSDPLFFSENGIITGLSDALGKMGWSAFAAGARLIENFRGTPDTLSGVDIEALSNQGNGLARSLVEREEDIDAIQQISEKQFLREESELIARLEDLFDAYMNVTWLSPQGQARVMADSEYDRHTLQDIYSRMGSQTLTSTSPCYPDLSLPTHPMFPQLDYGSLYTFPDFYFYNPAIDNETEENSLENQYLLSQIDTIVNNSYNAQKKFENGSLPPLGEEPVADNAGARFDGSDYHKDNSKAYSSIKEYKELDEQSMQSNGLDEIRSQFVTNAGHLEIANDANAFEREGVLDAQPILDHVFDQNALVKLAHESLMSLQKYKGTMRRAFPTFKFFFIEEDEEENWRALDDFYSYNAIRSIVLTRSAKVPADLCIIEMQNVSGVLDGSLFGGVVDVDHALSDTNNNGKLDTGFLTRQQTRRPGFEGTSQEDFFDSIVLREGVNVQLRLGYSNHPDLLSTVFNGRVVEVAWSENTDIVQITCQSYGTELVQIQKGITGNLMQGDSAEDNVTLSYGVAYKNTTELLSTLIKSPECAHFGRWKFGTVAQDEEAGSVGLDQKYYIPDSWGSQAGKSLLAIGLGVVIPPAAPSLLALKGSLIAAGGLGLLDAANGAISFKSSKSMHTTRWTQLLNLKSSIFSSDFKTSDFENDPNQSSAIDNMQSSANWLIGNALGGTSSELDAARRDGISVKRFLQLKWRTLQNHPGDDNIFAPHPTDYIDYGMFDYTGKITESETEYYLMNTTIWDVFQEMTYRHPGWIASPVPYGDRMTMFFGVPDQRYWARPASDEFIHRVKGLRQRILAAERSGIAPDSKIVSEYIHAIKLRFKPFRNYHLFTSYTDIVSNDISVSSEGVANAVTVEYQSRGLQEKWFDTVWNNGTTLLKPLRLAAYSATGGLAYRDEFSIFGSKVEKPEASTTSTFTLKYHPRIEDEDVYLNVISFDNCRGKEMALRYALKGLCDGLKEMYKGTITVLGNADIKPYDIGILFDTYSSMSGPFEIEEVTHFFSQDTGFISVLVPKAVVIANETSSSPMIDSMMWGAVKKAGEYASSVTKLGSIVIDNEESIGTRVAAGALGAVGPFNGMGANAVAGAGVHAAIGGLTAGYAFVTRDEVWVEDKDTKQMVLKPLQNPVTLLPLTMNGYPLTAGVPTGLADSMWTRFKGDWQRTFNAIELGFSEGLLAANTMGFDIVSAYGPDMSLVEKALITTTRNTQ